MITGNVVRLSGGHLVIITNVNEDTTQWVSFSCSNMSGVTRNLSYKENIDGMDKATIEARSVKDFIISRTMKNFEF